MNAPASKPGTACNRRRDGMVGGYALRCADHPRPVGTVMAVGRWTLAISPPKMKRFASGLRGWYSALADALSGQGRSDLLLGATRELFVPDAGSARVTVDYQ